ncbi:beta strand repeat-containing protein, partial [Methylobacter psychrophilus]|uniref:beta strand repeat-containing protein n=1 Tax=Methylobacter psychrophilus TaxID=96941 RepID=UPI0021D4A21C
MFAFTDANAGTNKTVTTSGVTVNDGNSGSNYNPVVYVDNTTSTINKAALTLGTSAVTKTYDGSLAAAGTAVVTLGTLYNNASNGGTLDSLSGGTFAFTNANAGTGKTVTTDAVTVNDGNLGGNYTVSYANNAASIIDKATLTLSTSDVTRTYDGTLAAAGTAVVTLGTLYTNASNSSTPDSISGGTFAFANKNASTGNKVVTTTGVAVSDGNSGSNYTVSYANNTTSTINKADLSLKTSDVTKAYNGTLAALGTAVSTSGTQVFSGDSLSGGMFAFTDANAGTNKTVTTSGVTVNDGNSGSNYNPVVYVDNTTSTINKAALTLATSAVTKTYDGSLAAAGTAVVTLGTLYNNASNGGTLDNLSGGTFAFTNANAGTGKTVTTDAVTVNDGNLGGNYTVSYANNAASIIDKATLTLSTSDVTRTYDGTLAAAGTAVVTLGTLYTNASNSSTPDSISGGTFAFANKNASTGNKVVTTTGVAVSDGNSGSNYTVSYANNTTSTINKADLSLKTSDVTKAYNGTLAALGTAVVSGGTQVFSGDSLSGGMFAFTDANAGTNKTVTTSGVTVNDGNSG